MKSVFTVFIILLVANYCYAQENQHQLRGVVKNDSIDVTNIKVFNKRSKQVIGTNSTGIFEIPVKLGDSIIISAIHIEEVLQVVTKDILTNKNIEINVIIALNQLEEVTIKNHNLTGNLMIDIANVPKKKPDLISNTALDFSVALRSSKKSSLKMSRRAEVTALANTDPTVRYGPGGAAGGNLLKGISLLSKLLGKKESKPKSFMKKETYTSYEKWTRFKKTCVKEFGITFFTKDLKISENQIEFFFDFCKNKKDIQRMYLKNQKLELIEFLILQSKLYLLELKETK